MSDSLRDRMLRELARHYGGWIDNGKPDSHCQCGHRGRLGEHHRRHVADAILVIPGIAVVEMPEPDYEDSTGHGWSGDPAGGVYAHGGKVYDEEGSHTPAQARAVAANWLAAADYAEKESKETQ